MDEVEVFAVDLGLELRPRVETGLGGAPVEVVLPVRAQLLQVRELGAVVPTRVIELSGPARARQPITEIGEHVVGHIDPEGRSCTRLNHRAIVAHASSVG